jgi:hypothetical protein
MRKIEALIEGAGVDADRDRAREVLPYAVGLGADEAMASLGQLLMGAAQWAHRVAARTGAGQETARRG